MRKICRLFVALIPVAAFTPSHAEAADSAYDGRWYLAPMIGRVWPDSGENTTTANAPQLYLGKQVSGEWDVEFGATGYSLPFKPPIRSGSFSETAYGVNGLWHFDGRDKAFSPFILMGSGANDQSSSLPAAGTRIRAYFSPGIGFVASPWSWGGSIRAQFEYLHSIRNNSYSDKILSVGLSIPLGSAGSSPTLPSAPLPRQATLPPEARAPRSAPAPVQNTSQVTVIPLPGVEFEPKSDQLKPGSFSALDGAVRMLREHPTLQAEVAGYTDDKGQAEDNRRLSLRRATAVMDYLVSRGVNAAHLSAKGYGGVNPLFPNDTALNRARNRRVELHILNP